MRIDDNGTFWGLGYEGPLSGGRGLDGKPVDDMR
jgi:hypothetical protein